jgi:hypothetical protein
VRGDKQKAAGKKERGTEIAESKEGKQQERKSGTSEEGTNPFRKSSRLKKSDKKREKKKDAWKEKFI